MHHVRVVCLTCRTHGFLETLSCLPPPFCLVYPWFRSVMLVFLGHRGRQRPRRRRGRRVSREKAEQIDPSQVKSTEHTDNSIAPHYTRALLARFS